MIKAVDYIFSDSPVNNVQKWKHYGEWIATNKIWIQCCLVDQSQSGEKSECDIMTWWQTHKSKLVRSLASPKITEASIPG
jgi:hypothetical protein